jgi:hypothetical protein
MKMSNDRTENQTASQTKRQNTAKKKSADDTIEVLYQKMGDRWFAFSLVNDEVFVGSLTQDEIAQAHDGANLSSKVHSISGNS